MNRSKYFNACIANLLVLFLFTQANAQTEINGPTPKEVIWNPYSQRNIQVQVGRNLLDWYGSGDVNNDGKVDNLDVEAMNSGAQNDEADIDGNAIIPCPAQVQLPFFDLRNILIAVLVIIVLYVLLNRSGKKKSKGKARTPKKRRK